MVECDITKYDDVKRAFKDSWAIFALTDPSTNPDQLELEKQQGFIMADAADTLHIPYYIFSTVEDVKKLSNGKFDIPIFTHKAEVTNYIKEKHPNLKTIFVEPAMYMQNWRNAGKLPRLDDGTVIFAAPIDQKAKLNLVDIDDIGPIVCEILTNPENFIGEYICVCGDEITLENMSQTFTKVTGILAIAKTLSEEEFRTVTKHLPKTLQDNVFGMHKWIEEYGYYGKDKDWTNGQKLTQLNTFEQWLRKTKWRGE
ncbi:hypothetical protein I4U23_003944 [Adineta vaga]|nr:hypothetical protein I4U23_003944 [Adineta vaga]